MEYKGLKWKNYPSDSTLITAENLQIMDDGVREASENITKLQEQLENIADIVYPPGAIYMSTSNVNPGNLFGGTWVQFAIGRTIIGINPDDVEFNAKEKMGGSKKKQIQVSNLPAHSHGYTPEGRLLGTAVTGEIGEAEHTHKYGYTIRSLDTYVQPISTAGSVVGVDLLKKGENMTTDIHDTGSNKHSHSFTSNSHIHSFQGNRTTTENTGGAQDMDIMPPYITCYIWKRLK